VFTGHETYLTRPSEKYGAEVQCTSRAGCLTSVARSYQTAYTLLDFDVKTNRYDVPAYLVPKAEH